MKNLNRKLSVVALSGMALFGGVAASVVPAFADSSIAIEQEVKDEDAVKLQKLINKAGYGGIYVVVKSGNKGKLLEEAEKLAQNSRFFYRGSMSINEKKPQKSLDRIFGRKHAAVVVKLGNKYFLVAENVL